MGYKLKVIENKKLLILVVGIMLMTSLLYAYFPFNRYDSNQFIAMADSYFNYGNLYPNDQYALGTSIYTPGMSLIFLLAYYFGLESLILLIAPMLYMGIIFFNIKLFQRLVVPNKDDKKMFFALASLFFAGCCFGAITYGLRGKPDFTAFLICFLGYYIHKKNDKKFLNILFGGLLIGLSILFKQQAVAFVLGLIFYCIFNLKDKRAIVFTCISLFFTFMSSLLIFSNKSIFLFTIESLTNDGFTPIFNLLVYFKDICIKLFVFFTLIFLSLKKVSKSKSSYNFIKDPLFFIGLSIFLASSASIIKAGGNSYNIEQGIFYLLPLFYKLTYKYKFSFNKLLLSSIVILALNFNFDVFYSIRNEITYKKTINELYANNKVKKILIDAENYHLVRKFLKDKVIIEDYSIPSYFDDKISLEDLICGKLMNNDLIIIPDIVLSCYNKDLFEVKKINDMRIIYRK